MTTTEDIFTGIWQNYNSERPTWTLTLTKREGGILSAALVIFVGFAATQGWNIIKFLLHQRRLGPNSDGLHQQHQAMLRNSNTHAQAAWLAIWIAIRWRRQGGVLLSLRRSLPVVLVALTSLAFWAGVQVLLSRIWTDAGDKFLVDSEMCGWINMTRITHRPNVVTYSAFLTQRVQTASSYVDLCYGVTPGQAVQGDSCRRLPRPSLDWTMSDVPCPFPDTSLCISANSTPAKLDTGYLSSNDHFGVNTRREDSILYRRITTCSPVTTKYQYSPAKGITSYYYGTDTSLNIIVGEPEGRTYTYHERPVYEEDLTTLTYTALPLVSTSAEDNIWQANRTIIDRDDISVTFMFITNPLAYGQRNYDPIFHTDQHQANLDPSFPLYNASAPISILGCAEETEFCNPAVQGDPVCATYKVRKGQGPLDPLEALQLSEKQVATFARFNFYQFQADISAASTTLLVSRSQHLGIQFAELPTTQWRLEVARWFSMGLAMIQQGFVDSVMGPSDPALEGYFPEVPMAAESCRQQVIRNAVGFQNFNMTIIVIVLSLGGTVIALGMSLDTTVGVVQRYILRTDGFVHWTLDGVFQLQRLAYRGAGVLSWRDIDDDIPTLNNGRPLPPVNRETMAFAKCGSEEELRLMHGLQTDGSAEE